MKKVNTGYGSVKLLRTRPTDKPLRYCGLKQTDSKKTWTPSLTHFLTSGPDLRYSKAQIRGSFTSENTFGPHWLKERRKQKVLPECFL